MHLEHSFVYTLYDTIFRYRDIRLTGIKRHFSKSINFPVLNSHGSIKMSLIYRCVRVNLKPDSPMTFSHVSIYYKIITLNPRRAQFQKY